jgi:hypothetical protein
MGLLSMAEDDRIPQLTEAEMQELVAARIEFERKSKRYRDWLRRHPPQADQDIWGNPIVRPITPEPWDEFGY